MKLHVWLWAVLGALVTGGLGAGGEPAYCPPPQPNFLQRLHPGGGWHPYTGGLLLFGLSTALMFAVMSRLITNRLRFQLGDLGEIPVTQEPLSAARGSGSN